MSIDDPTWMTKVFTEAVGILKHGLAAGDRHVVDKAEMRSKLGKAHGAIMWNTGDVELGGHEHDGLH